MTIKMYKNQKNDNKNKDIIKNCQKNNQLLGLFFVSIFYVMFSYRHLSLDQICLKIISMDRPEDI